MCFLVCYLVILFFFQKTKCASRLDFDSRIFYNIRYFENQEHSRETFFPHSSRYFEGVFPVICLKAVLK